MSGAMSDLDTLLSRARAGSGRLLVLTGAGISAESGIPTFRGAEGYWRVGSRNYHPMELATRSAFEAAPDDVWAWYLYRRAACLEAEPNAAHRALVALEEAFGDRFLLVTQNVDGLHLRAGSTRERTYEIHGNIHFMRCGAGCQDAPVPLPEGIPTVWQKERPLTEGERALLSCPRCGARSRPHVLWFDEYYDEPLFRFESSLTAAREADLLIVVGTTGGTNLPLQMGAAASRSGAPSVVVNPEPNPFSEELERSGNGVFLEGTAGRWVPELVARLSLRHGS